MGAMVYGPGGPEGAMETMGAVGAEIVRLEYTGPHAGSVTFMANGHSYRAGRNSLHQFLDVPREDALVLLGKAGQFREVATEPAQQASAPVGAAVGTAQAVTGDAGKALEIPADVVRDADGPITVVSPEGGALAQDNAVLAAQGEGSTLSQVNTAGAADGESATMAKAAATATTSSPADGLAELEGIPANVVEALRAAGITSAEDVRATTDGTLLEIEGIGMVTLGKLRDATEPDRVDRRWTR